MSLVNTLYTLQPVLLNKAKQVICSTAFDKHMFSIQHQNKIPSDQQSISSLYLAN